jgi:uncharacterized protein YkwD
MKRWKLPLTVLALILAIELPILLGYALRPPKVVSVQEKPVAKVEQQPEPKVTLSVPDMLAAVNRYRAKAGVNPLVLNDALNQSAIDKCKDMQSGPVAPNGSHYSYFAHDNPQTGMHGYTYAERSFPGAHGYAENLIIHEFKDSQTPIDMWYAHEGHRVNMLNPDYVYTGIAYCNANTYDDYSGTFYVVQHFAGAR